MRQARHLTEGSAGGNAVAFVKQEDRHAVETQLSRQLAQAVDILLHGVADKHQGAHPLFLGLCQGVRQHTLDLRSRRRRDVTERITRCSSAALLIQRLDLHSLKPR